MSVTVGVAGITGKFARELVYALLKYPEITVKGYCRDPSKIPQSFASKVAVVKGGAFDTAAIRSFVSGCDVVVCCYLGDNNLMLEGQKLLIDACAAEGVPRYLSADWAADYTKLELGQLFVKDPMIHVKAYLDAQDKVKGVHVLVGGFMDIVLAPHFGLWDGDSTAFKYWGTGDEVWECTTYRDSARYTAAICADKNAVGIKKLVGDRASIRDMTKAFEQVYGVQPKLERQGSLDDLFSRMHELQRTSPQEFLSYIPLFFTYYTVNGQTLMGPELDNDQYPQVKPMTFEEFFKATPREQISKAYAVVGEKD
ncbi:nmrA-like family protein [Hypoxylon sp. FL1284]|nr:nmrA-like family protein [Hypoxylon sp. FL1284]